MELGIVSLSLTLYLCHLINKQIKLDRVYYKVLLNLACIDTASVLQFMTEFNLLAIWMLKEAVTITVLSPLSNYTWLCWMAPHSSVLAWRIPGSGEPGGLPSLGSHRVGHDWSDLAAAAAVLCMLSLFSHVWLFALQAQMPTGSMPALFSVKWRQ